MNLLILWIPVSDKIENDAGIGIGGHFFGQGEYHVELELEPGSK